MADGKIIIDVDIITKRSEENIKALERAMKNSGDNISQENENSANKFANDWNKAKSQYEKSANEILAIQKQLNQIEIDSSSLQGKTDMTSVMKLQEMDLLSQGLIDKQDVLNAKNESYSLQMDIAGQKALELATHIRQADIETQKLKGANTENLTITQKMGLAISQAFTKTKELSNETVGLSKNMKQAEQSSKGMSKGISGGIKSVLKYAGALFGIRSIYMGLRKLSSEWMNSDQQAAQQLKANVNAITSALSNALAPVLIWIANLVMTIVGYANALLKAFFGVDLFAKSTAKSTKGTSGNVGSTAKGLKKANKELKRFTAGFDEAEVVSGNLADNMDGAGGGGGGGLDLPTAQIPTPDLTKIMQAFDKIKQMFDNIWNSDVIQSFLNLVQTIFRNAFDAMFSIATNYWDNVVQTWNAMLPNLTRGFTAMSEFWTSVFDDMADAVNKWIPIITNSINEVVDEIFATFRPLYVFLAGAWADVWEIMLEVWNKYGKKILDGIGGFIDGAIQTFKKLWTDVIDPIIRPAIEELQRLWDEHLRDTIKDVIDFVGEFISEVLRIWNEAIYPFIQKMIGVFGPSIVRVFNMITSVVGSVFGELIDTFRDLWNAVKQILRGILRFIEDVFTGNWRNAWEGLGMIVKGVFDGLVAVVKTPLNLIISLVNGFIRGLNRLKIPNFVPGIGGQGVNLPTIPRLAKGGVLTQPTLNIAGEYPNAKRNPEIVTPQNIMEETFAKVMAQQGNQGGTYVFEVNLDGQKIASVTKDKNELNNLQLNGAW